MSTAEKIRKLEREITALWQVIDDKRPWHPSVIREIRRRSRVTRRDQAKGRLKTAVEVLGRQFRR